MTLVVTHPFVSPKPQGGDSTRVYGPQWNANHTLTGTTDSTQLNANVVQAVVNDTNIQGSISAQTLTFSWGGTLAAARLNANVVQAITNDTNVTGTISAQNLTLGWTGQLGLVRGGTNADLSATGGTHQVLKQSGVGSAVTVGQLAFTDISGTASAAQLPNPTASTLGGVESYVAVSHQWINTISTSGVPSSTQPAIADISGWGTGVATAVGVNVGSAGAPVLFNGAGGTPTSLTLTNATGLPLTGLANQAAWTIVFNNTSGSAAPTANTIDGLTVKASPAAGDEVMIWDVAGAAIKKATVSSIGASSGVASIAGNTGAFTLAGGVTNSTNQIQHDGNYSGWALMNCTLAASVASNILTVALKDNAGNDPSATSPAYINYRNVTAATGSTSLVSQTAALSITTNATGATLGSSNANAFRFWVVVFNNGGTNVLALINCATTTQIFPLDETQVASSTAMSASATSAGVFYTPNGTTVTSKAFRILGYVEYNSTGLATAGTYATGPNFIQVFGPGIRKPGEVVQAKYVTNSTSTTVTNSTTQTQTNLSAAITPTSAANRVMVDARGALAQTNNAGTGSAVAQISRGSGPSLIGSLAQAYGGTQAGVSTASLFAFDFPNTASSTTYFVYVTCSTATTCTAIWEYSGLISSPGMMIVNEVMG